MIFCSVCFGDPNSLMTQGYNWGIISLLIVTFLVLAVFAFLFLNIRKRTLKIKNF